MALPAVMLIYTYMQLLSKITRCRNIIVINAFINHGFLMNHLIADNYTYVIILILDSGCLENWVKILIGLHLTTMSSDEKWGCGR